MLLRKRKKYVQLRQAGFSLVEILIGLVIGLLATLVIMQVFSVFEGKKRTTTGTADAQTNGGIALYSIVRDLQPAGFSLLPVDNTALNCATPTISAQATAVGVTSLSPVTITDGGTAPGASDSVTIRYGTSASAGTPVPITLMTGADASVDNNMGCEPGVAIILTGPTTCNVTTATALIGTTGVTLSDATGAIAGASLSCLGQWNEITYRVNASNLERNTDALTTKPLVTGIVNIQAQYGISAVASSNQVVQWVNATGTWAAPTTADRNRIKAVRIAVVARNDLQEKTDVSAACSSLTADAPNGVCAWSGSSSGTVPPSNAPVIDLSNDANWKRYRYRVFETIIPLRNVIWAKGKL